MTPEIEKQAREKAREIAASLARGHRFGRESLRQKYISSVSGLIQSALSEFYALGLKDGRAEVKKEADEVFTPIMERIHAVSTAPDFESVTVQFHVKAGDLRRAAEFLKKEEV